MLPEQIFLFRLVSFRSILSLLHFDQMHQEQQEFSIVNYSPSQYKLHIICSQVDNNNKGLLTIGVWPNKNNMNAPDFAETSQLWFLEKKQNKDHPEVINVKPFLTKAKDLIEKRLLNKAYPQFWGIQLGNDSPPQSIAPTHHYVPQESTQNQSRNLIQKIESPKLPSFMKKIRLFSQEWFQNFGKIKIYERYPNTNNCWPMKVYTALESKQQVLARQGSMRFNSRFQSGNLLSAYRQDQSHTYTLILQNDTNTMGYNNWFYFGVKSQSKFQTIKMQIVNMRKDFAMFRKGMKIAICAQIQNKWEWYRGGNSIFYEMNQFKDENGNSLYTLSFQFTFQEANKWVYFAYSYPYTYSDLKTDLKMLKLKSSALSTSKIGCTALKNEILMIENIEKTSKLFLESSKKLKKLKDVVVIMGRVHPSETVSSFVVRGILKELCQNEGKIQYLLENFIIKIVPMINPDGVIHGNTRTSFTGNDLNRRWGAPSPQLHPEICAIYAQIKKMHDKGHKILLMIDAHGHSKRQNAFFYGCTTTTDKKPQNHPLAKIFAQLDPNFKTQQCCYSITKDKVSTARVVFWREFKAFSYTLQCSYFGASQSFYHYSVANLENIGKNLIKAIAQFCYCVTSPNGGLMNCNSSSFIKNEEINSYLDYISSGVEDDATSISGSSSGPSQFNYDDRALEQLLFRGEHKLERISPNKRYSTFVRNLSLSPKKSQARISNKFIKDTPSKLPMTKIGFTSFESHELKAQTKNSSKQFPKFSTLQRPQRVTQFSAFNFKTRKGTLTRKKLLFADASIS